MNQVFAGATALIIALALWSFGKKPRAFLISKSFQSDLNGFNQQRLAFVVEANNTKNKQRSTQNLKRHKLHPPKTIQERVNLQKQLKKLISGNPEERLQAILLSKAWGHSTVLPILRKGLKDSDSRVVEMAAEAIEKFRRVPKQPFAQESSVIRPPRNVSLMR